MKKTVAILLVSLFLSCTNALVYASDTSVSAVSKRSIQGSTIHFEAQVANASPSGWQWTNFQVAYQYRISVARYGLGQDDKVRVVIINRKVSGRDSLERADERVIIKDLVWNGQEFVFISQVLATFNPESLWGWVKGYNIAQYKTEIAVVINGEWQTDENSYLNNFEINF